MYLPLVREASGQAEVAEDRNLERWRQDVGGRHVAEHQVARMDVGEGRQRSGEDQHSAVRPACVPAHDAIVQSAPGKWRTLRSSRR